MDVSVFRVLKKRCFGFWRSFFVALVGFFSNYSFYIYIDINRVERSVVPQQKSVFFERGVCRSFVRSFVRSKDDDDFDDDDDDFDDVRVVFFSSSKTSSSSSSSSSHLS